MAHIDPAPLDARAVAWRSIDPDDYQSLPRPVAVLAKGFPDSAEITPHHHPRDQLIYAVSGVMRVRTKGQAWIVPPDRAVYIPSSIVHAIDMRGDVEMRSLYLDPAAAADLPKTPRVLDVSDLLRQLILALIDEPLLYDEAGRGGAITRLILSEISRAPGLSLNIPMPADQRLERLCMALLADPASPLTLDAWAETAGASPRTLARLFRAEVGMGFTAWRQRVRFHNAMEALVRGEPIKRVAAANGYRSPSAFTSAFRKALGVTPSAFGE
jgi:AraC-like DNA-binding protein